MLRDGDVATATKGTFNHKWISDNYQSMKDMFCPSHYSAAYTQAVLMDSRELRLMAITQPTMMENPPIILEDVVSILTVNQGHARDCIVSKGDDTVWYVRIEKRNHINAPSFDWHTSQIPGLLASQIQTISLGDDVLGCNVVYKNDLQKMYRLNFTGIRSLISVNSNSFGELGSVSTTAVAGSYGSGSSDEEIIAIQGNEIGLGVLTTKKFVFWGSAMVLSEYGVYGHNEGEKPLYQPVATAYSFIYVTDKGAYAVSTKYSNMFPPVQIGSTVVDSGYFDLSQSPPC